MGCLHEKRPPSEAVAEFSFQRIGWSGDEPSAMPGPILGATAYRIDRDAAFEAKPIVTDERNPVWDAE